MQKVWDKITRYFGNRALATSLLLILIFWITESFLDAGHYSKGDLLESFFPSKVDELRLRMIMAISLLCFGYATQRVVNHRKAIASELRELHDSLEEQVIDRTKELQKEITERKQAQNQSIEYQQQLKQLAMSHAMAEEAERRRIALGLHDQIGHNLAAALMKLGLLGEGLESSRQKELLNEACEFVATSVQAARSLTFDISPPVLYDLGLLAALKWLGNKISDEHGIKVKCSGENLKSGFDTTTRNILFQSISELLTNVIKHARASETTITLSDDGQKMSCIIEDNGCGFEPEMVTGSSVSKGFGIFSIRERISHIGGSFQIDSRPGSGTRVILTVPVGATLPIGRGSS